MENINLYDLIEKDYLKNSKTNSRVLLTIIKKHNSSFDVDKKIPNDINLIVEIGYDRFMNEKLLADYNNKILTWKPVYNKYSTRKYCISVKQLFLNYKSKIDRERISFKESNQGKLDLSDEEFDKYTNFLIPMRYDYQDFENMASKDLIKYYKQPVTDLPIECGIYLEKNIFKDGCGGKLVSPISNNYKNIDILFNNYLKDVNEITSNCGANIKISTEILNTNQKKNNLLKLIMLYENVIYYFGFNNQINLPKDNILKNNSSPDDTAVPLRNKLIDNREVLDLLSYNGLLNETKNNSIDFYKDYIQINCIKNTNDICLWQSYINFFTHLVSYAASDNFDINYINYMLNSISRIDKTSDFKNVDSWSVIDLADLIFDNTNDKLTFIDSFKDNLSFKRNMHASTIYRKYKNNYLKEQLSIDKDNQLECDSNMLNSDCQLGTYEDNQVKVR